MDHTVMLVWAKEGIKISAASNKTSDTIHRLGYPDRVEINTFSVQTIVWETKIYEPK